MKNRILLAVVVLLIPIAVISFYHKKTNFYLDKKEKEEYYIFLKDYNQKIKLNDYVVGVVAAEMPALFNEEALKAQAIASRTFALYQMQHNNYVTLGDQAYITEEMMHEKWQDNYDKYYNKISKAVNGTGNLCIQYQNELIKAYYFAISSGVTEDAQLVFNESYDYLVPVESYQDLNVNKYKTEVVIPINEFLNKLNLSTIENISLIKDKQNYVDKLIIDNQNFDGIQIRKQLNLRSASFDIKKDDENITITCYGYGHGVGMSQYGANELAKINYDYEQIIKYYYQNVEIKEYDV